jgi:hypothetical protein
VNDKAQPHPSFFEGLFLVLENVPELFVFSTTQPLFPQKFASYLSPLTRQV